MLIFFYFVCTGEALAIVVSANCVTAITAISMSAVATNGLIQGGEFSLRKSLLVTVISRSAVATYGFMQRGELSSLLLDVTILLHRL